MTTDNNGAVSGAQRATWRAAAIESQRGMHRPHNLADGDWFDYNQRIVMLIDALDAVEDERNELRAVIDRVEQQTLEWTRQQSSSSAAAADIRHALRGDQ